MMLVALYIAGKSIEHTSDLRALKPSSASRPGPVHCIPSCTSAKSVTGDTVTFGTRCIRRVRPYPRPQDRALAELEGRSILY